MNTLEIKPPLELKDGWSASQMWWEAGSVVLLELGPGLRSRLDLDKNHLIDWPFSDVSEDVTLRLSQMLKG